MAVWISCGSIVEGGGMVVAMTSGKGGWSVVGADVNVGEE
jgi:hypothetical protein